MGKNKSKTSCFGEVFETILKAMMHGGTVLDFSESVSKTVNNMTIGKLSLLPTREEIVIDDEERKTTMNVNRISSHYDLYSATGIFNEKEITDIIGNTTLAINIPRAKSVIIPVANNIVTIIKYIDKNTIETSIGDSNILSNAILNNIVAIKNQKGENHGIF